MSALGYADKEVFAEDCQLKNFARLLLRIAQQVHETLNNPKLLDTNFDAWGPMLSKNEYDGRLSPNHTNDSVENTESNGSRIIEKADLCFFFWQLIRNCRELILKGLVLINIVEKPKFQLIMNHTLETASKYYENQEIFRKFGQQFNSIQWPPHGWGEPPCPPYAIDVSIDILCGKGNYRRLPKLLEEVVKQVGEVETSIGLALDEKERLALERRIKVEVTTMWALSKCPKKKMQFVLKNGMIFLVVPNEFSINAIFDLQRFQVIEAKILVGSTTFGIEVSPFLNTGFKNFLDQAIGLIEMRYHFAVEAVKNKLRELWNKKLNAKIVENGTDDTLVIQNSNDEMKSLEESLISLLCCEDSLINENLDNNNLFDNKEADNNVRFHPDGIYGEFGENGTNNKKIQTANELNLVKESEIKRFPDYFFECFRLGRWVSGFFILTLLRDQALRACSFSSVYPGCIKTFKEIGKKELSCFHMQNIADVTIKALDLYIVPCFDPTCGGLLSPLLCLLFEVPLLRKEIDPNHYLSSSFLEDYSNGYTMLKKISTVTSGIQHYELSGSGSILRIGFEVLGGDWKLILWPVSPLLEILKFVTNTSADENSNTQKNALRTVIKKNLLFDASYVYDALLDCHSYHFMKNFNAEHLELSLWTRHAASLLATLTLATVASFIKSHSTTSSQMIEVYLKNESDTFTTLHNRKFTSLDCIFFKKYLTHLHVDPFDGKLCISFSTLHKKTLNWLRLGNVEYDSQIATAISMGSLGSHGLLRLLPYLTYIAFVQYLEETCATHQWETDFSLQTTLDEHLNTTLSSQMQNNESSQFIEHGYRFPTSSFIDAEIGKNRNVSVIPPPDNVHMTELLYTLKNSFKLTSSKELSRSFCFVYKRESNLCLCIYGNTTAQCELECVKLVVTRVAPSK
ncbi:uncharacterized protein LOC128883104 [Hylaeus volcanicus]|uniref:uncharacterized protein LOC128883104 n=1 Tax=Hylaeus volcanicus TaxID=313075 RepID=UPI0023B8078F|nr:uncharacterized protein LOC128883104 [Hylaeus volcanicus]